ncbi:type II secretion system protein [Candidatus Gottesmanbacteria bacterium]|nr:type II secretion system protein [Candidatus Gottesmanbacteria bacterium]
MIGTYLKRSLNIDAGFTLIELVVVLGIFGILMVAGTEFFIQVIKNSNQATMQNEVRQEANKIMQDIVNEARKPGATYTSLNNLYTVSSGVLSKTGYGTISSRIVFVNLSISGSPILVTLTVQNDPVRFVRSDFQATVTLTQTVTPRQY